MQRLSVYENIIGGVAMKNTELKPCPFCGGQARKKETYLVAEDGPKVKLYTVGCENCVIEFSCLYDESVAIKLWNTRKPMDN